jgi:hypothetical protein
VSEANLWDAIRNNLGHRAHMSRIEFNPTEGHPDVSFCRKGIEGHMELKHTARVPVKVTTKCFGDHGLRDSQIAWIHKRVKQQGRVAIVAQVGEIILVIPGFEYRRFNDMTFFELGKAALWAEAPGGDPASWDRMLAALTAPLARYLGQAI